MNHGSIFQFRQSIRLIDFSMQNQSVSVWTWNHAYNTNEDRKVCAKKELCVHSICSALCINFLLFQEQLRSVTCWQRLLLAAAAESRSDRSKYGAHKQAYKGHKLLMWAKGLWPLLLNKQAWWMTIVLDGTEMLFHIKHQCFWIFSVGIYLPQREWGVV